MNERVRIFFSSHVGGAALRQKTELALSVTQVCYFCCTWFSSRLRNRSWLGYLGLTTLMIKYTRLDLKNLRLLDACLSWIIEKESVKKFLASSVSWFLAVEI